MKKMIMILTMVLAGTFSQASPQIINVTLEDDTQLIEVNVRARRAVSCPGSLELKSHLGFNGKGSILQTNQKSDLLKDLMGQVSDSCSAEIFDTTIPPQFQCLSFGHEGGRVYLDVRSLSGDVSELEIALPVYLQVVRINQFRF